MTAVTLHSTVTGPETAPALLLLNSFGATHAMWDPQIALLSEHFRVIRCDARGHGESPSPTPPYALEDLVGRMPLRCSTGMASKKQPCWACRSAA